MDTETHQRVGRLFEHHGTEVQQFVRRRCGDRHFAEDITSDTFIAAVAKFSDDPDSAVTVGWLIAVAKRRLVDHWRREASDRRRVTMLAFQPIPIVANDIVDDDLSDALAPLGSRQQQALMLRYVVGLSVSDVATRLDASYQATESLLARARRAFEQSYDEAFGLDARA